MFNPSHDDLVNLLLAEEQGLFDGSDGWQIFTIEMPDEPDNAIVLREYGGLEDERVQNGNWPPIQQPTVQCLVRGTDYTEAYKRIQMVIDCLDDHDEFDSSVFGCNSDPMRYIKIEKLGNVIPIVQDDRNRYRLSVDFQIMRQSRITRKNKK